jgi:hypothetical protein
MRRLRLIAASVFRLIGKDGAQLAVSPMGGQEECVRACGGGDFCNLIAGTDKLRCVLQYAG